MPGGALIEADGLAAGYNGRVAVEDVSFALRPG